MAETNYVSDAVDVPPEALMDEPFCTITLDLAQLPPQQALSLVQQVGFDRLGDGDRWKVGEVMVGNDVEFESTIDLHVDAGRAITFLNEVGVLDMGTPETDLREVEDSDEDE